MSTLDLGSGAGSRRRGTGPGSGVDRGSVTHAHRAPNGARAPFCAIGLEAFGELAPISRLSGQGRVHRPANTPRALAGGPIVVKLYRRSPPPAAAQVLAEMVAWKRSLEETQRLRLAHLAAWPLAVVTSGGQPVGIAMPDVSERFAVPFVMPSGRRPHVLLALEHLLGGDAYLQMRGLDVRLDTARRALIAERISMALAFLHRHAIVASDLAPSNLLVSFGAQGPAVCFIDCDSMVFRGRQALASVETGDWNIPAGFSELARTRGADAYKLGLVVLRLFARSHDARAVEPHRDDVPAQLRPLLSRALAPDAANRPPAGEWQRALRQLLADRHINERYPGPAPREPVASARPPTARANARPLTARPSARPLTTPASAPGIMASARPSPHASAPIGARRTVAILWILAGTVVLFLLLSRLFAAAIPQGIEGGATGVGGGAGGGVPYTYRYSYPPPGGGQFRGAGQALFPGGGQGTQSP